MPIAFYISCESLLRYTDLTASSAKGMCCALRHGRIKAFSLTAAKSSLCHYSVKMYPLYAGHFESQSTVALQLSHTQTHSDLTLDR